MLLHCSPKKKKIKGSVKQGSEEQYGKIEQQQKKKRNIILCLVSEISKEKEKCNAHAFCWLNCRKMGN